MSERGVFAVDRGIWEHDFLADNAPFTRREAWLWLVSEAAWKPHRRRITGKTYELGRGQLVASNRFIASKWHWSEARVRRFLSGLKTEGMVDAKTDAGITVITICKYDEYQRVSLPRDAASESDVDAGATQQRRKVEDKEDKEIDSLSSDATLFGNQPDEQERWPKNAWDRFWSRYPNKVGKKTAERSFSTARRKREVTFDALMAGLERYIETKPPDRAWLNPATWLNQGRWDDEPGTHATGRQNGFHGERAPRGGEAIDAGVGEVKNLFPWRHADTTDAAGEHGADEPRAGGNPRFDVDLPPSEYRARS